LTALLTFFSLLVLSFIVVRVTTVALTLTGLSAPVARFQARSAWTGTGFTTAESERMVDHPLRRRIISVLMLVRNAGLVTAVSTLILSLVKAPEEETGVQRLLLALGVLVGLWLISMSPVVDRFLTRTIRFLLTRFTEFDARDYASLLHLTGNYAVAEMVVNEGDWLADKRIREMELPEEGVLILAVRREDGSFVGAPQGDTAVHAGDTLVLYARRQILAGLDERPRGAEGEREHEAAVSEHHELAEHEQQEHDDSDGERGGVGQARES